MSGGFAVTIASPLLIKKNVKDIMKHVLPHNLWPFIGHFLKPYKHVVVMYVCLAMLAGCWGPFNSMLIKYMINALSLSHGGNSSFLPLPALLLVINFIILDNVTWRSIGYLNYKFQPAIKNRIISETFNYVLAASPQFFHDNLSGRVASQINILADNIERMLYPIPADFIRSFSLLMIALVSAYYVNPLFFYVLAVWFLAFSSLSISMSKRLVHLADAHADADSALSGNLVDSITNASTVRIFARRVHEVSRLESSLRVCQEKFQRKEIFLVTLHALQGMLIAIMLGGMVYFLITLYRQNLISIGDFALILGLSMELGHTMWSTTKYVDDFYQAIGKCKQSLAYLMVPHGIQDAKDAHSLLITKGEITFEDVTFHYQGMPPLFYNKSLTIEAGQKVGLVGYSGGGKSTFVNLILRLYDVSDGHIFIDGHEIRHVTQESLRRAIALIPQDPSLFHRTLMENIRYGRIQASEKDVIDAAKKAHAHEFISKLPNGYDSLVGDRGVKLSGGQRQRIAIARAILKNAPILILDEATSQLDSVTESFIQESLWQLMQGRTTIVIAHRLSTLLDMDSILVFDQGKIVEHGTHGELLAKGGLYTILWKAQLGGFLVV